MAAAQPVRVRQLYPEVRYEPVLPVNYEASGNDKFEIDGSYYMRSGIELQEFRDVTLYPCGFLQRGLKIIEPPVHRTLRAWRTPMGRLRRLANHLVKRPKERYDSAVWITDSLSRNYFHWITEAVPRLYVARDYYGALPPLLLPDWAERRQFVLQSLSQFNISNIKILRSKGHCNSLLVPWLGDKASVPNRELMNRVREFYLTRINSHTSSSYPDRIYVSRARAGRRGIANETAVVETLRKARFEIVYFEEHPFEEQVRIASNARVLVSPHGAGLANLLFMSPGSSVLEIRRRNSRHFMYFNLAVSQGINYYYQNCGVCGVDHDHAADLVVDCDMLERNIEKSCAPPPPY